MLSPPPVITFQWVTTMKALHSLLLACALLAPASHAANAITVDVMLDQSATDAYASDAVAEMYARAIVKEAGDLMRPLGASLDVKRVVLRANVVGHLQVGFLLSGLRTTLESDADVVLLLTKHSLQYGKIPVRGYATIGALCWDWAAAVVTLEDDGNDGEIIAHELSHVIGLFHDGDNQCTAESPYSWIMSGYTTGNRNYSPCSLEMGRSLVRNATCLNPAPEPQGRPLADVGGGAIDPSFSAVALASQNVRRVIKVILGILFASVIALAIAAWRVSK